MAKRKGKSSMAADQPPIVQPPIRLPTGSSINDVSGRTGGPDLEYGVPLGPEPDAGGGDRLRDALDAGRPDPNFGIPPGPDGDPDFELEHVLRPPVASTASPSPPAALRGQPGAIVKSRGRVFISERHDRDLLEQRERITRIQGLPPSPTPGESMGQRQYGALRPQAPEYREDEFSHQNTLAMRAAARNGGPKIGLKKDLYGKLGNHAESKNLETGRKIEPEDPKNNT